MKLFLLFIILIFNLQSLTKADSIRDFEIEGMSIGDSLLDYLSKDDIIDSPVKYYPESKKFKQISLYDKIKMQTYDVISVALKNDDKKKIIHEIKGFKKFLSHNKCLDYKNKVVEKLKTLFNSSTYKINSYEQTTGEDKDSIFKSVDFLFDSGTARVYCVNWSDKIRESKGGFYDDSLTVVIYDNEFKAFLKKAYK